MKTILKHALAVLLGLAVLNGFCAWYYNTAPYQYSDDRATDTVRRPHALVSQAKEGMGAHRIDGNGYNNPEEDGPVGVLMMGSSHTEGFNLPVGRDVSALLEQALSCRVYNIGMSSHTFPRNAANLARALERFKPARAVVLETDRVVFTRGTVNHSMADDMQRLPDTRVPLPDVVSNQPLSKRLYKQFMNLIQADPEAEAEVIDYDDIDPALLTEYEDSLTDWFGQLNDAARAHGATLVIWYHPHLTVDVDGHARADAPRVCLEAFANACDRAGVRFADMTGPFLEAYETRHVLPHGFGNTALGEGHLNAEGHRMAAEALAALLGEGGDGA